MGQKNILQRGMTHGVAVRYLMTDATEIAEQTRKAHSLKQDAVRIAAESMLASILMSSHTKREERLTVQIQSETPKFSFLCDVRADGTVRGRFIPQRIHQHGEIHGMMLVIKHDEVRELYRGVTPIEDKNIDQALRRHLMQSQQVDSSLRIAVLQNDDGSISRAVGVLVERLPPVPDLEHLEADEFREKYDNLIEMDANELIASLDSGKLLGHELHELHTKELRWKCRCSMDRILSMLRSLGVNELQSILIEQGKAEVTCDFCNRQFQVDRAGLETLINELLPAN